MTEMKRMPPLNMDEQILLIDTYFQIEAGAKGTLKKELIRELSDSMRALPFFPEFKQYPVFRSPAGMDMCLRGVTHVDPAKKTASFGSTTILQAKVFKYYSDKKKLLHSIAIAIKAISSLNFPLLPGYKNSIMGELLPSYHEYLENNSRAVKNARKILKLQGRTKCQICCSDLEDIYHELAYDLLEPHITLPVNMLGGNEKITLAEIVFLCPTCHKLAHSAPELFEEKNLVKLIKRK